MSRKDYKNMGRSNLTFLSADGYESLPEYQSALKKHNDNMAKIRTDLNKELESVKGYSSTDNQTRDFIYAKYENLFRAEKSRFDAEVSPMVKNEQKSSNLDNLLGGLNRSLDTTKSILSGFGIEAPSEKKDSAFKGRDDFKDEESGNKYLPYIIGGVALLGIFAFYVFKSKKG
jgi:hypothetical protein